MIEGQTMADAATNPASMPVASGATAGALLRAARERQGMHVAMLAAAMKVTPKKIEALEADRYDELPDATFARALAQSICRTLKIDATPVLAQLPHSSVGRLEHVSNGLNTPFRERSGPSEMVSTGGGMSRPLMYGGLVLLVAAILLAVMPRAPIENLLAKLRGAPASASANGTSSEPVMPPTATDPSASAAAADVGAAPQSPTTMVPVESSTPPATAEPARAPAEVAATAVPAATTAAAVSAGDGPPASGSAPVQLIAAGNSWVGVTDGAGKRVLDRQVRAGETVNVEGTLPLRVRIGNANQVQLIYRGQPVELTELTRGNVATVELK